MPLPEIGVKAIVANKPIFDRLIDSVNKALQKTGDTAESSAKRTQVLTRAYDAIAKAAQAAQKSISAAAGGITAAITGMVATIVGTIMTVVALVGSVLVAAVGVATAAIGGFFAVANRGAPLVGLRDSFDRLTASIGVSADAMLGRLRTAARGTVSDFDLIRQANVALAGAQGEFGRQFGEALPRILEIARVQARATGQDVDFLFSSLVSGVKRASPMLIDNTGLVLKLGAANEAMAAAVGVTVEQLTEEQKQIAILNALLESGATAVSTLGAANETAAEKMARAQASISNIFDTIGVALQPLLNAILDIVNTALSAIATFVSNAAPYIQAIAQIVAEMLVPVQAGIDSIAETLNNPDTPRAFFRGAVQAFGAYLAGVLEIGTHIINAVAQLAQTIADFLLGKSPPPMGPLSRMTTGAAATMRAWLEGFTGVSIDPVRKVAADVSAALGAVGKFNHQQVEARLRQLDKALAPFQQRLSIVKANFDAISEVANAALRAVERQLESAVEKLLRGEAGSAEAVRALDAQRQSIEDAVDAQQAYIDNAQIQLGIVQAQQAQERALLNIRRQQLGPQKAAAAVAQTIKKKTAEAAAGPKPKEPTGAGAATTPEAGAPMPAEPFKEAGKSNTLAVMHARQDIEDAWAEGFGTAGADFSAAQANLQRQGARMDLGFSNLPKRIGDEINKAFAPIGHFIQKHLLAAGDHLRLFVGTTVPGIFADLGTFITVTVPGFFATLPTNISDALLPIGNALNADLFTPISNVANRILTTFFGDYTAEGTIANFFYKLITQIPAALLNLGTTLYTVLFLPLQEKVTEIKDALFAFFADPTNPESVKGIIDATVAFFADIPSRIGSALSTLGTFLRDTFLAPFVTIFNSVLGALETLIRNALIGIATIAASLAQTMSGIPELSGIAGHTALLAVDAAREAAKFKITRLGIPGAAEGGTFGPGLLRVGERGQEIISAASRVSVFPNSVVRGLDALASVMASPAPYMSPSMVTNNSSSSYDQSMVNNFYGVRGSNDVMRRLSIARAYRK